MILNKMQQNLLSSNKRIMVLTAQAGAGTTTAIFLKLADEATKNKNNLVVYLKRTCKQIDSAVASFIKIESTARYSPDSNILTFKYNNKKVKIKMLSLDNLEMEKYIPVIAVDGASNFDREVIKNIISVSGRIILSDFISHVQDKESWAYLSNLLQDVDGKQTWSIAVDHLTGLQKDNPGLPETYIKTFDNLDHEIYNELMRINFK